jgi:MFS transporter, AAHS family, 3-hydroxyphenylpropionic acid transporter
VPGVSNLALYTAALPMRQVTLTHWPRVFTLWGCGIAAAMQFAKIAVAFGDLQTHYGASAASIGWILSTVGMVGLVLGVTMGLIAPRVGYRRLLVGGLVLGAVLAGVQTALLPWPLFWLTRVLEGASHLAVVVAAPTLMASAAAPRHRAIAMGLWSTFVGLAFAIAGLIGGPLIELGGLPSLFAVHAVFLALMAVAALRWVPTDVLWVAVPTPNRGAALHGLARLPQLLRAHATIYARWTTALPGLGFLCYTSMALALLTFLPRYGGEFHLLLAAVLPLIGVVGTFSAGWLAQYWVRPLVLVRMAFALVLIMAVALAAATALDCGFVVVALALMYCTGLAGGSAFSLIPVLNPESALQAKANGAVAQLGNLGSTLGPPLFALALGSFGVYGLVAAVMVCAGCGLGLGAWGGILQQRESH